MISIEFVICVTLVRNLEDMVVGTVEGREVG